MKMTFIKAAIRLLPLASMACFPTMSAVASAGLGRNLGGDDQPISIGSVLVRPDRLLVYTTSRNINVDLFNSTSLEDRINGLAGGANHPIATFLYEDKDRDNWRAWYVVTDGRSGKARIGLASLTDLRSLENETRYLLSKQFIDQSTNSTSFVIEPDFVWKAPAGVYANEVKRPTVGKSGETETSGLALLDSGIDKSLKPDRAWQGHAPFNVTIGNETVVCQPNEVRYDATLASVPEHGTLFDPTVKYDHGTRCADIALQHKGFFYVDCKVVDDNGFVDSSSIARAVTFVEGANAAHSPQYPPANIRVINMSVGGVSVTQETREQLKSLGFSDEPLNLHDVLETAWRGGVLVVCSAGNGHENSDLYPRYPAAYALSGGQDQALFNILTVAGTVAKPTQALALSGMSNYGMNSVHIADTAEDVNAPGIEGDLVSGTSFASADAAGYASELLSQKPDLPATYDGAQLLKWWVIDSGTPNKALVPFTLSGRCVPRVTGQKLPIRSEPTVRRFTTQVGRPDSGRASRDATLPDLTPRYQVLVCPGVCVLRAGTVIEGLQEPTAFIEKIGSLQGAASYEATTDRAGLKVTADAGTGKLKIDASDAPRGLYRVTVTARVEHYTPSTTLLLVSVY